MKKVLKVRKGICLALTALLLAPHGAGMAVAAGQDAKSVVTGDELYDAMSVQAAEDAVAREVVGKLLERSEVRRVAARAGMSLDQLRGAVSTLSSENLQLVADRAQQVDDALAGGSTVVITSTMLIIGFLVLIILLVA